jgi:hypothetical protein
MAFVTNTISLQRNGRIIARDVPVQIDTVNIELVMNAGGLIPTDSLEVYCDAPDFAESIPERGDYLIDQTSKVMYSVFGRAAVYSTHWESRVSQYTGVTP